MARKSKGQGQILSGSPQPNFTNFQAKTIQANRAPTTADTGYEIGQQWADMNSNILYGLASVSAGAAQWNLLGPGSSDVDTLTGDAGGAIAPVGGNITLAGGTNIGTSGAGSTITFNLDNAISLATSVTSPIYTTSAADMNIRAAAGKDIIMRMGDAAGANKVSFQDSGNVEVFAIDSNGAISTLTGLTVTGNFTQTAGVVSIGADNAANAITLGSGTTARTITIAGSTGAHVLTMGSLSGAASTTIQYGTGNFSLDGAATGNIAMGASMTSGTLTIGGTAQTGTFTLGGSTGIMTMNIANGNAAKTINIGSGVDGNTIAIGNGINTSAQTINIANGNSGANSTVNILSGTGTAGAGVLALGNNTRVTTIGIGNVAPAAARTITMNGGNSAQNDTLSVMSGNPSAGTQTVTILGGVPTGGTQALNLLTQTGQAGTVNIGTGAAMANNINIGGTGANVVAIANTQTGGSYSVGAAMTTGTVSIGGTGAQTGNFILAPSTGAQTITLGNNDGAKTINIGAGVSGNTISIGNGINTSAQTVNISAGAAGANSTVNILSGNATAGTQTLNLGTGTGGKTVSIASGAGANTVTVGSTNTTSSLTLQAGSGGITTTGTFASIAAKFVIPTGVSVTWNSNPVMLLKGSAPALPTGATGTTNVMALQEGIIMEQFVIGAGQTIIAPQMGASGLLVSGDLTATEGFEYNFGAALNTSRFAFTIGTSAAFFFEMRYTVADVSGASPYMIGFRKTEANNATLTNYTDYAMIGLDAVASVGNVVLKTELNSGGTTNTNTTDAWNDGETHTVRINVSAAGVVTYLIDGLAPTVTAAFTFDNGDVVAPFFRLEHAAVAPGAVNWVSMACGFQ